MGPKIMFLLIFCFSIENNFAQFIPDPFSPNFGQQLQAQIQAQMDKQMAPIRQMERKLRIGTGMTRGIGGITVALYGGKHRLIFIDGDCYSCPGDIRHNGDKTWVFCSKPLSSGLTKEQKLCGLQTFSSINDMFCVGESVSFNCNNGVCHCSGGIKYSLRDMKDRCGNTFGTNKYVTYSYYPNRASNQHIEVPNELCEEGGKNVCTWKTHHNNIGNI